jgi:sugar lactone lactonase YvrE
MKAARLFATRLILALLVTVGSARLAAAAAPIYEGSFTSASLCSPRAVATVPSGNVLVGSDCQNDHMEQFTSSGAFVGTWGFPAGFGGPPNGVAVDHSGNVYATDSQGGRVLGFTISGVPTTNWGPFSQPVDLDVDASGNVFILEMDANLVWKYAPNGAPLKRIGSSGGGPGQFESPIGIGLDASGRVYAADNVRNRILRFLPNGNFDMEFPVPVPPTDVAVGPDGNVYVIGADFATEVGQAYQYSPSGVLLQSFGSLYGPLRIVIDPNGSMFVSEELGGKISKFQIDVSTPTVNITLGRIKAMYR